MSYLFWIMTSYCLLLIRGICIVDHWELFYHTPVLRKAGNHFNTNIYLYLQMLSFFFTLNDLEFRLTTTYCFKHFLFNTFSCIIDNGTVEDAIAIVADWRPSIHDQIWLRNYYIPTQIELYLLGLNYRTDIFWQNWYYFKHSLAAESWVILQLLCRG